MLVVCTVLLSIVRYQTHTTYQTREVFTSYYKVSCIAYSYTHLITATRVYVIIELLMSIRKLLFIVKT